MKNIYRPEFFYLESNTDKKRFDDLLKKEPYIFDTIESQLRELIKVQNPSMNPTEGEYNAFIKEHLKGTDIYDYGVWVYYPWSHRIVHLLGEEEFIKVRTNRNKDKITEAEQELLRKKKVGIIGLSVGQSIALTLAMERACGALRLADFDVVELSNLNRIRTGVHQLNVSKVIIAAQEIAEIDPFIEVEIFAEGLTSENIEEFILSNGKLDTIVEVCDSLDVKMKTRIEAKKYRVPVVMETNDRCMVDVERFDVEPDRPILHGLVSVTDTDQLNALSPKEKIDLILKLVDGDGLSDRMKLSFSALGKTLRAWPQLASSVTLGGGVTTEVVRRLLLNEDFVSGRRYFDIDEVLLRDVKHTLG